MGFLTGLLLFVSLVVAWPVTLEVYLSLQGHRNAGRVYIRPGLLGWPQLELPLDMQFGLETLLDNLARSPRAQPPSGRARSGPATRKKRLPWLALARIATRATARFYRGITCHALSWHTTIGCPDAALTAVGTGMMWNLQNRAWLNLRQTAQVTFPAPDLQVKPAFSTPSFHSDLQCIFSLRPAHIIAVVITGLWNLLQGGIRHWKNLGILSRA